MQHQKIKNLTIASLFAALTCVATMVIQIPSPMTGYVNLGDCFVLLSGWILGPVYGTLAAGIGSMFSDIFTGYLHFAPGTLIVKSLIALTASLLFSVMNRNSNHDLIPRIASGIVGEIVMILGYFIYASILLGRGLAAAASVPGNIMQGIFGVVTAVLIYKLLARAKILEYMK